MTDSKVVVVGAGPAGLACAAELRRRSVPAVVLQHSDAVAMARYLVHYARRHDIDVHPGTLESIDRNGSGWLLQTSAGTVAADHVIVVAGYCCELAPLVGHLGVLDEGGVPRARTGEEAAPGLRFVGHQAQPARMGHMDREARRTAQAVARAVASAPPPPRVTVGAGSPAPVSG